MINQKEVIAEIEQKVFSGKAKLRNLDNIKELIKDSGWKAVCDILDISIARLSEKILDTTIEHDKESDDKDRETRDLFKWLRHLPEKLIEIFSGESTGAELPDHDPYHKIKETEV